MLGSWISLGNPVISEMASLMGFDWLLFDLEHGSFGEERLLENLQAVKAAGTCSIVRAPSLDAALIARVLDRGAHGVMVPHISSEEEARALVKATRYAPRGERGYSRTVRAYDYGLNVPADPASWRCVVIAQIENLPGVENVDQIAAVEGIDVLFVGPADLTHDLTSRGAVHQYQQCLEKVARAAQRHGKRSGILVRETGEIPMLEGLGYRFFAVDSDIGILRKGYQRTVESRSLFGT